MSEAGFAVAALVATVVGGAQQRKASQAQKRAGRRAALAERRQAEIENARQARKAIAQRRVEQARIIASAANEGSGLEGSSAVRGAVGSLSSSTAGEIGAANTRLASSIYISDQIRRGNEQAATAGTNAAIASSFASLATFGATSFGSPRDKLTNPNQTAAPKPTGQTRW